MKQFSTYTEIVMVKKNFYAFNLQLKTPSCLQLMQAF